MIRARSANSCRLFAGHQVQLAPPVARLDVAEAGVLVGRRAQRLGEDREAVDAQRDLAVARAQGRALDADQIAEVERGEALEVLLAEHVLARMQLDLARAVDEVQEGRPPGSTPRGDAPGDAVHL